jgi:hypothetical protein
MMLFGNWPGRFLGHPPPMGPHAGDDAERSADEICQDLGDIGIRDVLEKDQIASANREAGHERSYIVAVVDVQALEPESEYQDESAGE